MSENKIQKAFGAPVKSTFAWAAVVALIVLAQVFSIFSPLDRFLSDQRFQLSQRAASGEIVFLAIDKKSLDAIGVWPWPRSVHADITDKLWELGARDIIFDVDFSTPSLPANDAAFADAIERAEGIVTLPVFLQRPGADEPDAAPVVTAPIDMLGKRAWLAAVNVFPDSDGLVRRFPALLQMGDTVISSIPAAIAGTDGGAGNEIGIEFAIDPLSVPTVSVAGLLRGEVAPGLFEDRTVVVGAYATELHDIYAVPKYGVMAGPMLQIIAAETLIANRNIIPVVSLAADITAPALVFLLLYALRRRSSLAAGLALASVSAAAEAAGAYLYLEHGLMLPTAFLHVSTVLAFGLRSVAASDFFRRLSQEATADARNMRRVLEKVVHDNFDAIVVIDENGRVLQASAAVPQVFGTGEPVPERGTPAISFLPELICAQADQAIRSLRDGQAPKPITNTTTIMTRNATCPAIEYTIGLSTLDTAAGGGGRIVACVTARDVTDRLSYEQTLIRLSDRDGMTETWRRHAFLKTADDEFGKAEPGANFAIAAINLHRFKTVNIALGREAGNVVLRAVANRLRNAEGQTIGPARLGGDTFAVLLGNVKDAEDAQRLTQTIAAALKAPYGVGRGSARIAVQVGLAFWQGGAAGGENAEAVLDRAEMALDEARISSGSRAVFFDKDLAEQKLRARIIERDLWNALDRNELSLHYQLQVGLADGSARGAEALIRWDHPELGRVSPDEFTAIAEANGSITALGRWALSTACKEAAHWPVELSVAVNVAPQHFASDTLVADVEDALAESGLDASRLTVELVESELLETDAATLERIRALRELGVSIALDDFGTGYSIIGHLSRLRFDKIKLDRQFMADFETNPETHAIVRSVLALGEALGSLVVCEGVETKEQERLLRLFGCPECQGYLYSRPLPAEEFRALAGDHTGDRVATPA